ncbi:hypothetical protein SeLEV6574_g06331 [Synchytrium endobioticum]|nr:hypothetical protein SeLEV6574_g06331 [Synchytrium endobioticum]
MWRSPDRLRIPLSPETSVFVTGIPPDMPLSRIHELFQEFGPIVLIRSRQNPQQGRTHRDHCVIHYGVKNHAVAAVGGMNDYEVSTGRRIKVSSNREKYDRFSEAVNIIKRMEETRQCLVDWVMPRGGRERSSVFVDGVPFKFTADQVRERLTQYGTILGIKMPRPGPSRLTAFAIVTYSHPSEADAAIRQENGLRWGGRKISVLLDTNISSTGNGSAPTAGPAISVNASVLPSISSSLTSRLNDIPGIFHMPPPAAAPEAKDRLRDIADYSADYSFYDRLRLISEIEALVSPHAHLSVLYTSSKEITSSDYVLKRANTKRKDSTIRILVETENRDEEGSSTGLIQTPVSSDLTQLVDTTKLDRGVNAILIAPAPRMTNAIKMLSMKSEVWIV